MNGLAKRISEITRHAERVRENGDILVVIGIGGSNQASGEKLIEARRDGNVKSLHAGNIYLRHYENIINQLEGKSVYINVIAKNFETLEPGISFRILRQYLKKRYGAEYGDLDYLQPETREVIT